MTLELILYLFQNRSRMATQGKSEEKNLPVVPPQGEDLEGMASRSGIPSTTEDRTGRNHVFNQGPNWQKTCFNKGRNWEKKIFSSSNKWLSKTDLQTSDFIFDCKEI